MVDLAHLLPLGPCLKYIFPPFSPFISPSNLKSKHPLVLLGTSSGPVSPRIHNTSQHVHYGWKLRTRKRSELINILQRFFTQVKVTLGVSVTINKPCPVLGEQRRGGEDPECFILSEREEQQFKPLETKSN